MAFVLDGPNKLITLTAGTTTMAAPALYSAWVDWVALSDNSKYLPAFRTVGGDDVDVTAGTKVPAYCYLTNGWRVRPQEANHTLGVTGGVLLVDGGGDPFVNTVGSFVVRVNYSQPVQAITVSTGGGSSPTAAEIAAQVRAELAAELAQLTKVSKIHGVGVPLVVTATSRTAGDLSQTISTVSGTTTVSAV